MSSNDDATVSFLYMLNSLNSLIIRCHLKNKLHWVTIAIARQRERGREGERAATDANGDISGISKNKKKTFQRTRKEGRSRSSGTSSSTICANESSVNSGPEEGT